MREEIENRVFRVIREVLPPAMRNSIALSREILLVEDLKMDSIDLVTLFLALEDEFKGSVDQDATYTVRTIGDTINLIEQVFGTEYSA